MEVMAKMNVIETVFDNVNIVEPDVYKDYRGFFKESYNKKSLDNYKCHINSFRTIYQNRWKQGQ